MTVQRTYVNHQTRYGLRGDPAQSCTLTYTAAPNESAAWKILLSGPAGTEDLYGTHQFLAPDAGQLTTWLTPIIGRDRAGKLVQAVDAEPPPTADWRAS